MRTLSKLRNVNSCQIKANLVWNMISISTIRGIDRISHLNMKLWDSMRSTSQAQIRVRQQLRDVEMECQLRNSWAILKILWNDRIRQLQMWAQKSTPARLRSGQKHFWFKNRKQLWHAMTHHTSRRKRPIQVKFVTQSMPAAAQTLCSYSLAMLGYPKRGSAQKRDQTKVLYRAD